MAWESSAQIAARLKASPNRDAIAQLYTVHAYLAEAVMAVDYGASERWMELIVPTEAGRACLTEASGGTHDLPNSDVLLSLMMVFYHQDLLVDSEACNLTGMFDLLSQEALAGRLRWPYRLGRSLYEKFNDTVDSKVIDRLSPSAGTVLLEDTSQGIYVMGNTVSGPLGFLQGFESRFLPPTRVVPLWHCSDSGCRAEHTVRFLRPDVPCMKSYPHLVDSARRLWGVSSNWRTAFRDLVVVDSWERGRRHFDLPTFLGDCLIGAELTNLLSAVLAGSRGEMLRGVLGSPPRKKAIANGSPREVAERLQPGEQLQLLLLLPDSELVEALDELVYSGAISIPEMEVRRPWHGTPRRSPRDQSTELSSNGLRAIRRENGMLTLRSNLLESYAATNNLAELDWRLRRLEGASRDKALMDYLRETDLPKIIRELVLSSGPVTAEFAERLALRVRGDESHEVLIGRLLWKSGFDVPSYPKDYPLLRERLSQFKEAVEAVGAVRTETERATIRSAGVNLFVSVEYCLQELVAYNVWLLAADHFLGSGFSYDSEAALRLVPAVLGDTLPAGEQSFAWDRSGGNVLGTLFRYLEEACRWMRIVQAGDRSGVIRPAQELPYYADWEPRVFPFRHTALWADADPGELSRYVEGFLGIASGLTRSEAGSVRNGLDHWRTESTFPTTEKMLACVTRLRDAFDSADNLRYLPQLMWLQSQTSDRYGRSELILVDHAGRRLRMNSPSIAAGLRSFKFGDSVVVAPGNLLALPNTLLVFRTVPKSLYRAYWAGYPRRRRISVSDQGELASIEAADA